MYDHYLSPHTNYNSHEAQHHQEPSKRETTSPLPPTQTEQRQPLRSRRYFLLKKKKKQEAAVCLEILYSKHYLVIEYSFVDCSNTISVYTHLEESKNTFPFCLPFLR